MSPEACQSSIYGKEAPALTMAKRKLEEPPATEDASKLVMHPDIPKLVKSMSVVKTRAAACKRLVILAELGQKSFIISHGAVPKALAMLEGSQASSSAAVQLLELLMDPQVRRLCAQPHVAKRLMELCTAESSAGVVLCTLLRCEKLCAASGHLAHPAVALLCQGRALGAQVLASLAPHHGTRIVEMGALQDLFAMLRREERRWSALALRGLASQGLCPSAAELLEMMRDTEATEDLAARAAAMEALEFLARDVAQRPRLMMDAAVFLRCLDADEPVSQQAAAKTLLHLLQTQDPCTQLRNVFSDFSCGI